uniref:Ribonuclease R n=1 Tax=uncultured Thiotrichaceae bacterium TaxID=298394 RepID=A0A6S6U251_9GAMM|nr:MAG: 3'-to-5' exoribonuclease RNase R [uncultured Thiotrichaceae bacterium]
MKSNDPHHQREAANYDNPIPSREMILSTLNDSEKPLDFLSLATELGLSEEMDLDALKNRLRAMERDGQMLYNRRKQYIPVKRTDLIAGRVQGHADGFGFLIPDDGSDDLFLHAKQMRGLMHGDRILASVRGVDRKGRREGNAVEVLERGTEQVVGRFKIENGIPLVIPDNSRISQDILIPPDQANDVKPGQIVVAGIVEQPTRRSQPVGRIVEVLGDHMAPGMEIGIALRSHDLPFEWPAAVTEEAGKLGAEVPEEAKEGRLDLRNTPLVTIDGEDARDFDDAVYCERVGDHWRLLVAIADVSAYVMPGNALDEEAVSRATSVYFPGEVIPMLPEALSNGLCSLNPAVDRLCMVCETHIADNGDVLSFEFHEGVMHSAARLTYTRMADIVVGQDKKLRDEYSEIVDHLDDLYSLYHVLRSQRSERGAIDFETTETRMIFGEDRKITEIVPTVRNDAHKIIEECMILANVCAARFLKKHKIPALHRVHDQPNADKLEDVRTFLGGVGLSLGGGMEPEPADYARVLSSVQGRPDAHLIQTVLLRSLSQAVYSPDTIGHFGLAQEDYAHFTSPIRRYPDLLVHRAIRHIVQGNKASTFKYSTEDMVSLGQHCSMAERRADDASRDVVSWLKCEYMQEHVGGTYDGVISAATSFGLFVELNDIYVEGLVHVTALANDYYKFDPVRHRLTGESSGRTFSLGDSITVKVARVDLDERKIDFVLEDSGKQSKPPKKSKKFKGKSRKKKRS